MTAVLTYLKESLTSSWEVVNTVSAQVYGGVGIDGGAEIAGEVVGDADLRETVVTILKTVLTYMALAAVVVIVIAGIILVVSGGEEANKDRAKRMIIYTLIGLVVILLARGLVIIFAQDIPTG